MARVKPERFNIYDNLFTLSDFIQMAESEIESMQHEYNKLPSMIEEINEFILDHKSDPKFAKEIEEKRLYRRKLYGKQATLVRRMTRQREQIKEYKVIMNAKN